MPMAIHGGGSFPRFPDIHWGFIPLSRLGLPFASSAERLLRVSIRAAAEKLGLMLRPFNLQMHLGNNEFLNQSSVRASFIR